MSLFLSSPINSFGSPVKSLLMSRTSTGDTGVESPYKSRLQSIGKRFSEIQETVEVKQHVGKSEQVESKIRNIDAKIIDNHGFVEEKLRLCNNEIVKLEQEIGAEISTIQFLDETCSNDVIQVENNLVLKIQSEQKQSKENNRKAQSAVDNKIVNLRDDFVEESRKIGAVKEEQSNKLSEQISNLKQSIKEEGVNREQAQEGIIKKFSTKLSAIRETIKREQKVRIETENFLFSKIEQVNHHLNNQTRNERENREKTETQMLMLLEEACARYEEQVRLWRR